MTKSWSINTLPKAPSFKLGHSSWTGPTPSFATGWTGNAASPDLTQPVLPEFCHRRLLSSEQVIAAVQRYHCGC